MIRKNWRAIHLLAAVTAVIVSMNQISTVEPYESQTDITTTTASQRMAQQQHQSTRTTKDTARSAPKVGKQVAQANEQVDDAAAVTTTVAPPKDLDEVKRIIKQHINPNHGETRLAMNKPTQTPQISDFAPDSIEARVSEATTQFGLNFINNLSGDISENVVISPLSLQNLLNMILLGTKDNSSSQQELVKVLGYDSTDLFDDFSADRLKPHDAMHSVFQSILAATHLSGSLPPATETDLLNTNPGALGQAKPPGKVSALLQTSNRDNDVPLSGQVNFTLANLVLTNRDMIELKPEYEKELKAYYEVKLENFSKAPATNASKEEPLHERVNKWVKSKTQNMIDKLASESDLDNDNLIMVLVNAAHFKGRWLHTFNTKATHDQIFYNYGSEKEASRVKFMRQKSMFGYADFGTASLQQDMPMPDSKTKSSEDAETLLTEDAAKSGADSPAGNIKSTAGGTWPTIELSKEEARRMELTSKLNCSALMLPFSLNDGQELSMVLLLPAKRDGIAELQAALDGPALNEIYRSLSEQQVQVELPKFTFEAAQDAKDTLIKMGLKNIFEETAHLERMYVTNTNGLAKVDKIVHKAKINVDESGAEAAAASMASIVLRNFIRPPAPVFVADHPFLFVIRHNRSNMPLFMGRVSKL